MLTDSEKRQIGETFDDGTEIVAFEYFHPNGTRAGVEHHAIEQGAGGDMIDQIREMQKYGCLPGLRKGFREVHVLVHMRGYTQMIPMNDLDQLDSRNDKTFRILRGRPCWIIAVWGEEHPPAGERDPDTRPDWIPVEVTCVDLERHRFIGVQRDGFIGVTCATEFDEHNGIRCYDKVRLDDGTETVVVGFSPVRVMTCDEHGRNRCFRPDELEVIDHI